MRGATLINPRLRAAHADTLKRVASIVARHRAVAACLVTSAGWGLMWAQALALVPLPAWFGVGLFCAGLALIPLCAPKPSRG